jgi:hypothetical protein
MQHGRLDAFPCVSLAIILAELDTDVTTIPVTCNHVMIKRPQGDCDSGLECHSGLILVQTVKIRGFFWHFKRLQQLKAYNS